MPGAARTVAAFDLDGTLTRRDTLLPFLYRVAGAGPTARAVLAEAPRLVGVVAGRVSRDEAKEALLVRLLPGMEPAHLEAEAEAYAEEVVARRLRPWVQERVAWHREAGHALVIVSASPELYVAPVGRFLGFDAVLATRLQVGRDGRLTGRMDGLNCRGQEKVARLRAWLGDGPVVLYAYGDSSGDRELLDLADTPVRVRRGQVPPLPQPAAAGPPAPA